MEKQIANGQHIHSIHYEVKKAIYVTLICEIMRSIVYNMYKKDYNKYLNYKPSNYDQRQSIMADGSI